MNALGNLHFKSELFMDCGELKLEFFVHLKLNSKEFQLTERVKLKEQLTALIKAFPAVRRLLSTRSFVP